MYVLSPQIVPNMPSPLQPGKDQEIFYSIITRANIPTTLAKLTAAARFGRPTPPVVGLVDDAELFATAVPLAVGPLVTGVTPDEALKADATNVALVLEFDVVTSPAEDVACVALLAVVAAEVLLGRAESNPPAAVASPPNPEYVCR